MKGLVLILPSLLFLGGRGRGNLFAQLKLRRDAAGCMLAGDSRSHTENCYSGFTFFETHTYQEACNE